MRKAEIRQQNNGNDEGIAAESYSDDAGTDEGYELADAMSAYASTTTPPTIVVSPTTATKGVVSSSPNVARKIMTSNKPPVLGQTRPNSARPASSLSGSHDWSREKLLGFNRCTRCVRVVQVPRRADNKIVAVRKITSPIPMKVWPDDAHEAYKEVKKLTALPEHKNLVTFRAMFEGDFQMDPQGPQPFVEMELFRKGSLHAKIQKHFELRGAFSGRQIVSYMHQLTSAVLFLHTNGILHRDIRPKNIFILEDDVLKLADVACPKVYQNRTHASRFTAAFWLAKHRVVRGGPMHCCISSPGSWPYMPPEIMCEFKKRAKEDVHVCDTKLYTAASDIWSMGVVLYEMLVLKVPFSGRVPKQVQKSIADAAPLAQLWVPAVKNYSAETTELVNRMLCLEPTERVKAKDLEQLLKQQLQKVDMLQAAEEGDLERIRTLVIKERADVNDKDVNGYTALIKAAENGHHDVVQYLIDNRADINAKTRSGATAIEWAHNDNIKDLIATARANQTNQFQHPRLRNN